MRGWKFTLPRRQDYSDSAMSSGLVQGTGEAPEILEEDIDIMFSTNVTGLINMTQTVLPIFKARDEGGRGDIINIGSIAGREGYPGGSIYCASKAAVRTFTDALRRELIATRIRVMEVDPGWSFFFGALLTPFKTFHELRLSAYPRAETLTRNFAIGQVETVTPRV